jgi:hypothetical protein
MAMCEFCEEVNGSDVFEEEFSPLDLAVGGILAILDSVNENSTDPDVAIKALDVFESALLVEITEEAEFCDGDCDGWDEAHDEY